MIPGKTDDHSRGEDEDVVVSGQVGFEPYDRTQVQMTGRLVQEQEVWFDEQGSGKSNSHPPTSGHVLGGLGQHGLGETQTGKNGTGLGLESVDVSHLLELLVLGLESQLVDIVSDRHVLDLLLQSLHLCLGRGDDVVDSVDLRRLDGTTDEVDLLYRGRTLARQLRPNSRSTHINVFGNLDISLGDRFQEGRLSATVLSQKTITLTVVQGDLSTLDQQTSVIRQRVRVDLDVSSLDVGYQDTVCGSTIMSSREGFLSTSA